MQDCLWIVSAQGSVIDFLRMVKVSHRPTLFQPLICKVLKLLLHLDLAFFSCVISDKVIVFCRYQISASKF